MAGTNPKRSLSFKATDVNRTTRNVGLTSLAIGVLALVYAFDRHHESAEDLQLNESENDSIGILNTDGSPQDPVNPTSERTQGDSDGAQSFAKANGEPQSDRAADLKQLREMATEDVTEAYSLIFKHLALTETEQRRLGDFLIEVWMSSTYMGDYRPEPIPERDRRAGIAAIIGDAKLEQLLDLERYRSEYIEAARIAALLDSNNAPISEGRQDQLWTF